MTVVRSATPGDAHALVDLAESVGREDGRWILGSGPWRSISDERRFLRTIHRHPDAAVFVVDDAGAIVGRLSLARDSHPASRHVADVGLMVAESHRRQGVGTMLLEQAVAWARESDVRKLELHVFPWNEPALGLYESFGFVREGYRKRHYDRGGELVDAILMAYFVVG
jgi:RimJ/RimL family protein N-acetyltransferase